MWQSSPRGHSCTGCPDGHSSGPSRARVAYSESSSAPGAFFAFYGRSVSALTGKTVRFAHVFGQEGAQWAKSMAAASSDDERAVLSDSFWRLRREASAERFLEAPSLATLAAELIIAERSILSVSEAAARAGVDIRMLQRLFRREVGIGPKEVIRRFRLQESAERLASHPELQCGELPSTLVTTTRPISSGISRRSSGYRLMHTGAARLPTADSAHRAPARRLPLTARGC